MTSSKSIFAKILDTFDDMIEDWTITADEIKCYLFFNRKGSHERVDKLVNMLTAASFLTNTPKSITIGGKRAYAKMSPLETIETEQLVKVFLKRADSLELISEVSSIVSEGGKDTEFQHEEFIKAVNEEI